MVIQFSPVIVKLLTTDLTGYFKSIRMMKWGLKSLAIFGMLEKNMIFLLVFVTAGSRRCHEK